MFRNTDIIPSDFIAGFVLLRVKQKRESREQRRLALLAEQRYNCTSSKSKLNYKWSGVDRLFGGWRDGFHI